MKNLKNLKKVLGELLGDFILILGAALIAAGVGMIYVPAGVITSGVLVVAGIALANRGGGGDA